MYTSSRAKKITDLKKKKVVVKKPEKHTECSQSIKPFIGAQTDKIYRIPFATFSSENSILKILFLITLLFNELSCMDVISK